MTHYRISRCSLAQWRAVDHGHGRWSGRPRYTAGPAVCVCVCVREKDGYRDTQREVERRYHHLLRVPRRELERDAASKLCWTHWTFYRCFLHIVTLVCTTLDQCSHLGPFWMLYTHLRFIETTHFSKCAHIPSCCIRYIFVRTFFHMYYTSHLRE